MKQNIAKVLTFSLLATSAVFISCVDNEKNLFDAEQLRQIYEETFPVKNIDPDGTTMPLHINSKRRKKLRQKKTALGHAEDDHEDWNMEQKM